MFRVTEPPTDKFLFTGSGVQKADAVGLPRWSGKERPVAEGVEVLLGRDVDHLAVLHHLAYHHPILLPPLSSRHFVFFLRHYFWPGVE